MGIQVVSCLLLLQQYYCGTSVRLFSVHMHKNPSRGQSLEWNGCFVGLHIIHFTKQCQIVFQNGYMLSEGEFLLLYILDNPSLVRIFILANLVGEEKYIIMFLIYIS